MGVWVRKVWRFSFDPVTKNMFGADCGELEEEEINLVVKGGNYGWPVMEGNAISIRPIQLIIPGLLHPLTVILTKKACVSLADFFILVMTCLC